MNGKYEYIEQNILQPEKFRLRISVTFEDYEYFESKQKISVTFETWPNLRLLLMMTHQYTSRTRRGIFSPSKIRGEEDELSENHLQKVQTNLCSNFLTIL